MQLDKKLSPVQIKRISMGLIVICSLTLPTLAYFKSMLNSELYVVKDDLMQVMELQNKRKAYEREISKRKKFETLKGEFANYVTERRYITTERHKYNVNLDKVVQLQSLPVKLASLRSIAGKYYVPSTFFLAYQGLEPTPNLEERIKSAIKSTGEGLQMKFNSSVISYR